MLSDGWLAMGTLFEVDLRIEPARGPAARAWIAWAREEIRRLEGIYSRWDPDSALSRLNRALARPPGTRAALPVLPAELRALLRDAGALSLATGGAFDATVGPLVALWQGAAETGEAPAADLRAEMRARIGHQRLELASDGGIRRAPPGLQIDLDAISKGAVLERLAAALRARLPETPALLSFGQSSVVAIGDPDGGGWRLALRSRGPGEPILDRIALRDRALSVSSSVGSLRGPTGWPLAPVVDPRSGEPVEGVVEAVAVGRSAVAVDAWSTALLVLAAVERPGMALRGRLDDAGIEARVDAPWGGWETSGWSRLAVQSAR